MLFLPLLISNEKLDKLPNKTRQKLIDEAYLQASPMQIPAIKYAFWFGALSCALLLGFFSYNYGLKTGVISFSMALIVFLTFMTYRVKPYVVKQLPKEYQP